MKKLITLIAVLIALQAQATKYYFSTSGSTLNTGLSTASPWPLSRMSITGVGGDTLAFKCGDTFIGTTNYSRSGSAGHQIVFDRYGTGNNPVLDGGGSTTNSTIKISASYITINNLVIQNSAYSQGAVYITALSHDITIYNCYINHCRRGINAQNCGSGGVANLSFTHNYIDNFSDTGSGGSFSSGAGQAIQLNTCIGSGIDVGWNKCYTVVTPPSATTPYVGDVISIYKCIGTSSSYILVHDNLVRGGGSELFGKAGLILGDVGGAWQRGYNNIFINSGCMGFQVQGGHDIIAENNTSYGSLFSYSGEAIAFGNFSGQPCYNITIQNNISNWLSYSNTVTNTDIHNGSNSTSTGFSGGAALAIPTGWSTNTPLRTADSRAYNALLPNPLWTGTPWNADVIVTPHITYTPRTQSGTYGVALTPTSAANSGGSVVTWTSSGLPTGVTFTAGTITGTPRQVGTFVIPISATNSAGTSRDTVTLVIGKKSLVISAISTSKQQGTGNPALQYSYNGGLVNGDTSIATPPTISTTAVTNSPVGNYSVTLSGAASGVYNITLIPGSLTVYSGVLVIGYTAVIL